MGIRGLSLAAFLGTSPGSDAVNTRGQWRIGDWVAIAASNGIGLSWLLSSDQGSIMMGGTCRSHEYCMQNICLGAKSLLPTNSVEASP